MREAAGAGGTTEHATIPMADGATLAVTLYLPAPVGTGGRVPCLLEALPYRKDDLTAGYRPEYVRFRDEHGYALARVDLRGTGSSSGIALDEYHLQEQADLVEAIAWLAAQAWCTGAIGMFGTSWSGFNALQLACERPPALRAIVSTYASDDRWTDDVHFMGGALRLLDLVDYPLYMVAMNGLPPVPDRFGPGWRAEWSRRAADTPPWLLRWIEEQVDGVHWRQGSVRTRSLAPVAEASLDEGYRRIACPAMLITGWADGYRNVTYRLPVALADAGVPVRVLAGPWSHASPTTALPGPNVDHVPLMARWWDRWLLDDGEAHEDAVRAEDAAPPFTVYVRGYGAPDVAAAQVPGRWEARDLADVRETRELVFGFTPDVGARLDGGQVDGSVARYEPVPDVGLAAWNSCAAALPWGQPRDQTPDDARSLCLTWPPDLVAGLTVLGHPRLHLRVLPDHPLAAVSAKLSLIPPSGRPAMLVDRGLLNLAYREGDGTSPARCRPGEWVDVEIELEATAFEVTPGCALRLSLACADWPNTVTLPGTWSALDLAESHLLLPVVQPSPHPPPDLPPPPTPGADEEEDDSWVTWREGHDVLTGSTWAEVDHGSRYAGAPSSTCAEHYTGRVEIGAGVQRLTARARYEVTWPEVRATSQADLTVTADQETYDVHLTLRVDDGTEELVDRHWHRRIPRTWT